MKPSNGFFFGNNLTEFEASHVAGDEYGASVIGKERFTADDVKVFVLELITGGQEFVQQRIGKTKEVSQRRKDRGLFFQKTGGIGVPQVAETHTPHSGKRRPINDQHRPDGEPEKGPSAEAVKEIKKTNTGYRRGFGN